MQVLNKLAVLVGAPGKPLSVSSCFLQGKKVASGHQVAGFLHMHLDKLSRRLGERVTKQLLASPSTVLQLLDDLEADQRKRTAPKELAPIHLALREATSPSGKRSTSLTKKSLNLQTRAQVLRRLQLQSPGPSKRR